MSRASRAAASRTAEDHTAARRFGSAARRFVSAADATTVGGLLLLSMFGCISLPPEFAFLFGCSVTIRLMPQGSSALQALGSADEMAGPGPRATRDRGAGRSR